MIIHDIPGSKRYEFSVLLLDFNGTLAAGGRLIEGVYGRLEKLTESIEVRVLTADTYGGVEEALAGLDLSLVIIPKEEQTLAKRKVVQGLQVQGKEVLALGNGSNDADMLAQADLSIGVMESEGLSIKALLKADIVCRSIEEALDLVTNHKAMTATRRQ